jgi:hypothetical protein
LQLVDLFGVQKKFQLRANWSLSQVITASGGARVKLNKNRSHFQVDVNAGWEWFSTTIIDVGPTDLIAVGNRSHHILKLFSGSKMFLFRSNWSPS